MAKTKRKQNDMRAFLWVPFALVAVVIAFLAQYVWNPASRNTAAQQETTVIAEMDNTGGIRISECMSSNKSAWADDEGVYSDYVELYNSSNKRVDLTGWVLTDSIDRAYPFTFPETVLEGGAYLLVYCSGNQKNTPGYAYHAPFKLSASGDSVILCNAQGSVVESVTLPALTANQAYARKNGTGAFEVTGEFTPSLANTAQNHEALRGSSNVTSGSPIALSEIMAENVTYAKTADGRHTDWIELHNTSNSAVSLKNYGLSDSEKDLFKFRFGDVTIEANGYLLVYCDGMASTQSEIHAPFKLNGEGETVTLTDNSGVVIESMSYELLKSDVSYSKVNGVWTKESAPTPGYSNDANGAAQVEKSLRASNTSGLLISEAVSSGHIQSTYKDAVDWLELRNTTNEAINLAGYGLSDDPSQPRKWQFPKGTTIAAGAYLAVALTGDDTYNHEKQMYKTNFSLAFSGQETLILASPDGTVLDRVPMMGQRGGISFGRVDGEDGFFYFDSQTRGEANSANAFRGLCGEVSASVAGGIYDAGTTLSVELTAKSGTIHYTLDCSEPTQDSPVYEGPIVVTQTTILRAASFAEGSLKSLTHTESYLVGISHTLPVFSIVTDPTYLYDEKIGIYVKGTGTSLKTYNYYRDLERAGNAEYFRNGETVFSQGIGLRLQGQYSRQLPQKGFKLIARNCYGKSAIEGKLFPNLEYTQFDSVALRASGQDNNGTRFKDAMLTSLAACTGLLYQDADPVIVYLNGEYWGHYNLRERTNAEFVARHLGWTDSEKIDLVKANGNVLQGSDESMDKLVAWIKKNGADTDEKIAYIDTVIDIDNYLDYVAIQMYIGNTDLLNIKRYKSVEGDNRWRWILFDTDTAFIYNTDSYSRWLNPEGAGSFNKYDNTIFVQLMKNKTIRQKFWRKLNNYMANYWTPAIIQEKAQQWYQTLLPEMEQNFEKWGGSMSAWKTAIKRVLNRVNERPTNFIKFIAGKTGMNKEEMREYFGDVMAQLGM